MGENGREREREILLLMARTVKVLGRRRQWNREYQTRIIIDFCVMFVSCLAHIE